MHTGPKVMFTDLFHKYFCNGDGSCNGDGNGNSNGDGNGDNDGNGNGNSKGEGKTNRLTGMAMMRVCTRPDGQPQGDKQG
jgi:hypothetical protein